MPERESVLCARYIAVAMLKRKSWRIEAVPAVAPAVVQESLAVHLILELQFMVRNPPHLSAGAKAAAVTARVEKILSF